MDCGTLALLLSHAREHVAEMRTPSGPCPWPDCDMPVMRKELADHLARRHYGLRWQCVACSAEWTTPRDAAECKHHALLSIPDLDAAPSRRARTVKVEDAPGHSMLERAVNDADFEDVEPDGADNEEDDEYRDEAWLVEGEEEEDEEELDDDFVDDDDLLLYKHRRNKGAAPSRRASARRPAREREAREAREVRELLEMHPVVSASTAAKAPAPAKAPPSVVVDDLDLDLDLDVGTSIVPSAPELSSGDATLFAENMAAMLCGAGMTAQTVPLKSTLAASPPRLRALSPAARGHVARAFLQELRLVLQDPERPVYSSDDLWKSFALAYTYALQLSVPFVSSGKERSAQQLLEMARVVNPLPQSVPEPTRPSGPTTATQLLEQSRGLTTLLEDADKRIRQLINVAAISKRRIAILDAENRSTKKLLLEANRLLVMAQNTNRELRVKMIYEERETRLKMERFARALSDKEGGTKLTPQLAHAVEQLARLKAEVLNMCPIFASELDFERKDLVFVSDTGKREFLAAIRVTHDASGRRWMALNDLKRCATAPRVTAIVSRIALGERDNFVTQLLCLRPVSALQPGSEPATSELIVSMDLPAFGGGMSINDGW